MAESITTDAWILINSPCKNPLTVLPVADFCSVANCQAFNSLCVCVYATALTGFRSTAQANSLATVSCFAADSAQGRCIELILEIASMLTLTGLVCAVG